MILRVLDYAEHDALINIDIFQGIIIIETSVLVYDGLCFKSP